MFNIYNHKFTSSLYNIQVMLTKIAVKSKEIILRQQKTTGNETRGGR